MANQAFKDLQQLISSMNVAEQAASFCFDVTKMGNEAHWSRDRNLRDVLTHLYEWHQLLINWEKSNSEGIDRQFLLVPYNWKNYGEMNRDFWKKHQTTKLIDAQQMLLDSHQAALAVINKYSDKQLFTKAFYKWTGTTSLAQYCISATASHYDWAIKKLRAQIKAYSKINIAA